MDYAYKELKLNAYNFKWQKYFFLLYGSYYAEKALQKLSKTLFKYTNCAEM